jgi:ubiquitin-protein ligase
MPNARDLRLQADYEQVRALASNSSGRLVIESTKGHPPDEYILVYHCRSIEAVSDGKPVYRSVNRVRIKLPARYPVPSAPPVAEFQTPIFSPHVYLNRVVCMGDWQTSEYLEDIVLRIGAMMQFDRRYMNVLDPANEQAMYWVTQNLLILPSDNISFMGNDPPLTKASAAKPVSDLPTISDLMRQAGEPKEEAFTGLTEETSLVWQDVE